MPGSAKAGAGSSGPRSEVPLPKGVHMRMSRPEDVPQGDACGAASSLSSASDFCVGVFKTGKSLDLVDPERRSMFQCFTIGYRGWGPTDVIILPKLSKSSLIASLLFLFLMRIMYKMVKNNLALPLVPEPATKE